MGVGVCARARVYVYVWARACVASYVCVYVCMVRMVGQDAVKTLHVHTLLRNAWPGTDKVEERDKK